MTTQTELSPRAAVRQLHVLYGIAMVNKLTEPALYICDVYGELARGLHQILLGITAGNHVPIELSWLADEWEEVARTSDGKTAALFGSWAGNIRNIR